MIDRLLSLLPVVGFEIALSAFLTAILVITASLSVGTFAFVYQGF